MNRFERTRHSCPRCQKTNTGERMYRWSLGLLLAAAWLVFPKVACAAGMPREIDTYIQKVLRDWELPGAAIAIVKDGHLVAAKGYGVRERGKPDRVDANTIFDAASITKAFTAAAIGSLVDEKKQSWDEPVRTYLPKLEFSDPYLTANVTLRDLLCHRVG